MALSSRPVALTTRPVGCFDSSCACSTVFLPPVSHMIGASHHAWHLVNAKGCLPRVGYTSRGIRDTSPNPREPPNRWHAAIRLLQFRPVFVPCDDIVTTPRNDVITRRGS